MGMAFNRTGTKAYVAGEPNVVFVIDTSSLATLARVNVGSLPCDIVVDKNGKDVWVSGAGQTGVWRVNAISNKLTGVPDSPQLGRTMGLLIFR